MRALLKAVAQNPQDETQDDEQSCKNIIAIVATDTSLLGEPRRKIIGWLNKCYHSSLTNAFWFEMHTRMGELLTVAGALEGLNLKSFGVTVPDVTDIPTAIGYLYHNIMGYREYYLAQDKENYAALYKEKAMQNIAKVYLSSWQ